jgi:protein-tyrosine phosphatase
VILNDSLPEKEYCDQLFQAASVLDQLISQGKHKVYVHCCSGVTRGPTLAVVYLCLFLKVQQWQSIFEVEKLVRQAHPVAVVNMKAVARAVKEYKWY